MTFSSRNRIRFANAPDCPFACTKLVPTALTRADAIAVSRSHGTFIVRSRWFAHPRDLA